MKTSIRNALLLAGVAAAAVMAHQHGGDGPSQASDGSGFVSSDSRPPVAPEATVQVVDHRVTVPGYDRSCSAGDGCVFGPAWSDDVRVEGGRNGCDTRNDILRRDLEQVELKDDTQGCVVLTGILIDPYTGQTVQFDRHLNGSEVHIDHIVPLAAAWDHGAWAWDEERRRDFANDPRNLVATTAAANQGKGDKMPHQWWPQVGECQYATAVLDVTLAYDLTLTQADLHIITTTLKDC